MVIPNIKIKPIPDPPFPQDIDSSIPAIALSILTLQAATFDNARFDNVIHSSLSNSLIPYSRFGLLRHIVVKDGAIIFFIAVGAFSLDLT
jgi:hypothetical protein